MDRLDPNKDRLTYLVIEVGKALHLNNADLIEAAQVLTELLAGCITQAKSDLKDKLKQTIFAELNDSENGEVIDLTEFVKAGKH